jgi:hypothetical protein
MTDRLVAALAEVIWVASRKDEGTISATGANIVAQALIEQFGLHEETCCTDLPDDYRVVTCMELGMPCVTRIAGKWSEREGL